MQTRGRSGELIRNGNVALSSSAAAEASVYVLFLQIGAHSRLHIKEPKHTHTHTHTHARTHARTHLRTHARTHTHTHTNILIIQNFVYTVLNNKQALELEEDSSADRKI